MNIADLHCDTIEKLYHNHGESLERNTGHLNLEHMIQGEYLVQNFAVFVDQKDTRDSMEEALHMIDRFYRELEKACAYLAPAGNFQDIVNNRAAGKMSAVLTLEEGGVLKGRLENLRNFYRLGVRMITLTWNYENELGVPNLTFNPAGQPLFHDRNQAGLKEFGILAVEEMERLGMIPDVSHLSDGGFWDVVRYTKKPFAASHSNGTEICPVCRNLTDDMIRAMGERGCVIGINFCEDFLTESRMRTPEQIKEAVLAHINHIVRTGGMDVCALGSDFDGISGNRWLTDGSKMAELVRAMEEYGFTQTEIEKICYKNVLRLYREVL